jgi:hypothetical protein
MSSAPVGRPRATCGQAGAAERSRTKATMSLAGRAPWRRPASPPSRNRISAGMPRIW